MMSNSGPNRSKKNPTAQQQGQQSRAKWTDPLTMILVDLMVDQAHKGNRANNFFGMKAWRCICDGFYKETGLTWDKDQLKNRCAVLRKQYVLVKSLLDQEDFNWSESTGTIIASDEVWDQYIKEHPDADAIRSAGCPMYKQLCTIFSLSESGKKVKYESSAEHDEEGTPYQILCPAPIRTLLAESSSEFDEEVEVSYEPERIQPTVPNSAGRRGKRTYNDTVTDALLKAVSACKPITSGIEQYNARFCIANCIRALDEMEGLDEKVYFAALDLFDTANARETFLSLKIEKRRVWLYGKCGVNSVSQLYERQQYS